MGDYRSSGFSDLSDHTEGQAEHDSLYSNPVQQVHHLREKGDTDEEIEDFLREKYDEDVVAEIMGMASLKIEAKDVEWEFSRKTVFENAQGRSLTGRELGALAWNDENTVELNSNGFVVDDDVYQSINIGTDRQNSTGGTGDSPDSPTLDDF